MWKNVMRAVARSPRRVFVLLVTLACLTICVRAESKSAGQPWVVVSYALSPGGTKLAEVERNASSSHGIEWIAIRDIGSNHVKVVFKGRGIGTVLWRNSRTILFSEYGSVNEIQWENILSHARGILLQSKHPLNFSAYDRRRGLLAYSYAVPWRWRGRNSVRVKGGMTTLELISPRWARWPVVERVGAVRLVRESPGYSAKTIDFSMTRFKLAPQLIWNRGRLLGLVSSLQSIRTKLYDIESGARIHRHIPLFRIDSMFSSPRGRLLLISNRIDRNLSSKRQCGCVGSLKAFVLRSRGGVREASALTARRFIRDVGGVWFSGGDRVFIDSLGFKRPGGANYWRIDEVDTKTDTLMRVLRWPHGDLGGYGRACQFNTDRTRAVCIAQTLRDPPRLVEINLHSGEMTSLGKLDPREHRLNFGFKTVRVPSSFGTYSTAFLAVPSGSEGRSVPLAVMAYGFSESYSRYAQWITSYPVERLVHAGIAVMLVTWANIDDRGFGNFMASKRAQESAVSTFAHAIPAAESVGVHVSRAMVMGWSFGGMFAADAIERLHQYVAAEVGDPADYNVTEYALGGSLWRRESSIFFGGAPVGKNIRRYEYFDPAGSGKPANGPVLLEFVSRNPDAGQLLEEWKATGTTVEAFAYRRSVHWLSVPAEARISRKRNLYWAELNLLGPSAVSRAQLNSVGLSIPKEGGGSAVAE
ncbi:MAG: hypothetical protein M0038_04565 [Pseudomonadota bacterium]|nr:hypothetical protein [Pseudomonadota bacterium]